MKVEVGISIGLSGCRIESEIEVDDDATPEEIAEQVREWALGEVDWWHRVK